MLIASTLLMATGDVRRLIIAMPPRTMKSFMASVCLRPGLLGSNPGEKIICACYAQDLSEEFVFRDAAADAVRTGTDGLSQHASRSQESRARRSRTTRGGQPPGDVGTGGALTGRGGDFIIIDDPMKAADAHSEVARETPSNGTAVRLRAALTIPRRARIIVIAQRLHHGRSAGPATPVGWTGISSTAAGRMEGARYRSRAGLHPDESPVTFSTKNASARRKLRAYASEMGERDFEAQYNQRPLPPGGALFKLEWLQRYDEPPPPRKCRASFSPGTPPYEIDEHHDYSVCTTWALSGKRCYLLDVYRERLEFYDLEKAIYRQREKWSADLVIVENIGSGKSVRQNIRRATGVNIWIAATETAGSRRTAPRSRRPSSSAARSGSPPKRHGCGLSRMNLPAFRMASTTIRSTAWSSSSLPSIPEDCFYGRSLRGAVRISSLDAGGFSFIAQRIAHAEFHGRRGRACGKPSRIWRHGSLIEPSCITPMPASHHDR